ncbi:MAG TPA: nitroreductase/quinone reductase family protein [Candidatus Lustribacter sp.]|nr:nitroreductase/quinone reductase family protein [Candidatus Lustribacter sp.]
MSIEGDYAPSPTGWVRRQVEQIDAAGDTRAVSIGESEVVLLTMVGRKTGQVRKVPLIRVHHEGRYVAVGSRGGAPANPEWVANLRANPELVLMDGNESTPMRARELSGAERQQWWQRAVGTFAPYAEYQSKTERLIPLFALEPSP